jgi:uncharacterized protein (TIGR02001 family)
MKKTSRALASAIALAAVGANAQTAPPAADASPLSANLSLTTKYKFRGQDQGNTSWFSPAIQGGFDWSMNGFYLGNWNSNVSFSNAAIEMDFYAGYKGEITKDLGFDVGVLQYYYPQKNKTVDFDVTELYAGIAYQWLSFKYSHTVSKDYFGIGESFQLGVPLAYRPSGRNTGYFDLSANVPLVEKLTLNAHVGYTRFASDLRDVQDAGGAGIGVPNYTDYKLGVTYDVGAGFAAAAAYVGATRKSYFGDINKARVILTVAMSL